MEDSQNIDQNELNKACFQFGIAYGDFQDLPRRIAFDKICDKAMNIAKNSKCRYQRGLISLDFFYKKTAGGAVKIKIMQNQE